MSYELRVAVVTADLPDDGLYALSTDEESRILHLIAQEAGWSGFDVAESDDWTQHRLLTALRTGELPSRLPPRLDDGQRID